VLCSCGLLLGVLALCITSVPGELHEPQLAITV